MFSLLFIGSVPGCTQTIFVLYLKRTVAVFCRVRHQCPVILNALERHRSIRIVLSFNCLCHKNIPFTCPGLLCWVALCGRIWQLQWKLVSYSCPVMQLQCRILGFLSVSLFCKSIFTFLLFGDSVPGSFSSCKTGHRKTKMTHLQKKGLVCFNNFSD